MFKGINTYSMLKNGTIAVLTMFGVGILFGEKNIMLAFPIALTSAVLGRQNFKVKTFNKTIRIILIDLIIVTLAYISRLNIFIGIFINFISIFLIMYTITSPYDPTFYKPFIMLYVFTQYAWVPLNKMPARYLSVIFGVLIIVICNKIVNEINEKSLLGKSIYKALSLISEGLKDILEGNYTKKKELECTNIMRALAYKVYVSRYKDYLTTNLGQIQFKIFMDIEHLNLFLRKIEEGYSHKDITKREIEELISLVEQIKKFSNGNINVEQVVNETNRYVNKYIKEAKYGYEISVILINLSKNINSLNAVDRREINKVYEKWQRSYLDKTRYTFKEYFRKDSIRFKFAMRMAITLTLSLFVGEILGFYKIIWAIITIMSVIQPYYEDTLKKTKDRVVGNTIAIIFTGVAINLIDNKFVTIAILIASLYLLYAFKEYHKISLFAAIASISVSSLSNNINELLLYRIAYVIVGVLIVIIANKYIFPYKLQDGIRQLEEKVKRYNEMLLKEGKLYLQDEGDIHIVRDIIIHLTLMNQKLYLRNIQYGDENVDIFIDDNTYFAIEVGYSILMSYGKSKEFKEKKLEEISKLKLN
ncbi:FUSC family protein [Clostridium sp. NSJ-145]|uniref:FUSC family protein n=1 Tax=Clostridium sp. NSJ-145 TaxID=2897777 RepID=UPI001E504676|nr:FUSC family protein [Clostridium sp. NSJ-145]MCD2502091.1 FUSC family protein [Clostridium sp. NSJ-145]MDU6340155.1 FUSC family protein [Clostridium sp.]